MQSSPVPLSSKTGMALAALASAALACLVPSPVRAQTVVSSTGVHLLSSAPPSVVEGQITSNTQTTAFQEMQDVPLANALGVDISTPGTYNSAHPLTPGTIAAGSKVNSFFFYSDPQNNNKGVGFTGSLTFDSDILGLIVRVNSLNQTDPVLGASGTTYPTGAPADTDRGLEITGTGPDSVTLSADRRTLTYNFNTAQFVDEVRVVTSAAPVPEASTTVSFGLLLALGLGGLVVAAKRRKTNGAV